MLFKIMTKLILVKTKQIFRWKRLLLFIIKYYKTFGEHFLTICLLDTIKLKSEMSSNLLTTGF